MKKALLDWKTKVKNKHGADVEGTWVKLKVIGEDKKEQEQPSFWFLELDAQGEVTNAWEE